MIKAVFFPCTGSPSSSNSSDKKSSARVLSASVSSTDFERSTLFFAERDCQPRCTCLSDSPDHAITHSSWKLSNITFAFMTYNETPGPSITQEVCFESETYHIWVNQKCSNISFLTPTMIQAFSPDA